jgi:hypothetical protein
LIGTYPEGGHHEVKNFLIAFPNGAGDQLLQLEESGLNAEHGGDGADRDLGGLSGIEDQEKNSRKELVAVLRLRIQIPYSVSSRQSLLKMLKFSFLSFLLVLTVGVNCQLETSFVPTTPPPQTSTTTTRPSRQVITVTNGETEGQWGPLERCPKCARVVSYQTQNELAIPRFDDAALNTIVLFCNDKFITNFTSTAGL